MSDQSYERSRDRDVLGGVRWVSVSVSVGMLSVMCVDFAVSVRAGVQWLGWSWSDWTWIDEFLCDGQQNSDFTVETA